jgi:hypothetical protein
MNLPGSGQLGKSKAFLERFEWWKLRPAPADRETVVDGSEPDPTSWGSWIWYPEGDPATDAPVAPRYFRRPFVVADSKAVQRATLRVAADDRHTAFLNGVQVSAGAGWSDVREIDVTQQLRTGANVLAIRAENLAAPVTKNPAGLLCTLIIHHHDDSVEQIVSDGSWRAAKTAGPGWESQSYIDADWPAAMKAAEYGSGPWGTIADAGRYLRPYDASLPDGTRIVYVPLARSIELHGLDELKPYTIEVYDPAAGKTYPPETYPARGSGGLSVEAPKGVGDWVAVVRPARR